MICVNLFEYNRLCAPTSGGISSILIFDPYDFNFFLHKDEKGNPLGYIAVLPSEAAEAQKDKKVYMYPIEFERKEAEYKFSESRNGCSVKYEHVVTAKMPDLSQDLTNFLMSLDAAACCCGLGVIIRLNSGKIFVMGEKYINDKEGLFFEVTMDGTEGGSGKTREDFNGVTVQFKGEFGRPLYEFIGDYKILSDLMPKYGPQKPPKEDPNPPAPNPPAPNPPAPNPPAPKSDEKSKSSQK